MIEIKRYFRPDRGFENVEQLNGYIFSPEAQAHTFIISQLVLVDGVETPAEFQSTATVSCRFLKHNQVTELVEGSIESGKAVVTLPAECYAVPGRFTMTILLTKDSSVTCIYAAAGSVLDADSENVNVSQNTVRDVDEKIAEINSASATAQAAVSQVQAAVAGVPAVIASIPQDYTALSNSVGDLKSHLDGKIGNAKNELQSVETLGANSISFGWLQSSDIYTNDGTDRADRPTRSRSEYITLVKNATLTIDPESYYIQYHKYTMAGVWLEMSTFTAAWTNAEFTLRNTDADYQYRFVVRDSDPSANVTAADVDVTGLMEYPIVATVNDHTDKIDGILADKSFEIVSPTSLRICGGIEQNMFFQNILKGKKVSDTYQINTTTYATNYNDFARLSKPDNTSESHGFLFRVYPDNSNAYTDSKALNYQIVPRTSGSGLSKKVMIIGDSHTFDPPMTKHLVDELLTGDAMNVTLVGTLGNAPYNREGRSGWSAYTYTHESSYTNASGTTSTNAFWNPSSSAFDFSYYANEKYETITGSAFPGVDYVFICLGTNDFGRTDVTENLQAMITSIHTYDADIRIGVWTPPPRGLTGNGSMVNHDVIMGIVSDILTAFEGQEASRIYTVPVTLNVDPYHDFPMDYDNVYADDGTGNITINADYPFLLTTDKVHPTSIGYARMGDMIYSYIKYFGILDANNS